MGARIIWTGILDFDGWEKNSAISLSSGIETKTIHRFVMPRQLNREMDEYILFRHTLSLIHTHHSPCWHCTVSCRCIAFTRTHVNTMFLNGIEAINSIFQAYANQADVLKKNGMIKTILSVHSPFTATPSWACVWIFLLFISIFYFYFSFVVIVDVRELRVSDLCLYFACILTHLKWTREIRQHWANGSIKNGMLNVNIPIFCLNVHDFYA